ncbi:MAG: flavodoxin-dependent (E)-4-hydroxy-3-methylbut-2-enyl-diphosphate synthase [Bacilli bacterium]
MFIYNNTERSKNMKRTGTRIIKVGNLTIGGKNEVIIQSMCNIKTSNTKEVIKQVLELEKVGCQIIRVSIKDNEDAIALKEIKKHIHIPLVADIHFDYKLALLAIENGADKIRINPGNIGSYNKLKKVVLACKDKNIPIRIGVNSGSLNQEEDNSYKVTAKAMVDKAKEYVSLLENLDFYDICISLKSSSTLESIEAYRLASEIFPYPLHLGITEAGIKEVGIIRSIAGLAPLLEQDIGDTIRISLTDDPKEEVIACKRLLHDLGLYDKMPTLISCPTCGRTEVNLIELSKKVQDYLDTISKPITVAIMGCIVNGPGEAKQADIGIAGGKNCWVLFKKGQVVKKISEEEVYQTLIGEINAY